MLFPFRLGKPNPYCLLTAIGSPTYLKLDSLPFSEGIIVHPLELAAMEEEVFLPLTPDKPKAAVYN